MWLVISELVKCCSRHDFNHLLEDRRYAKFLFEQKLRNVIDGSAPHIAVSTEEALEVIRPVSKDENIISQEVWSIKIAEGHVNMMNGPIY